MLRWAFVLALLLPIGGLPAAQNDKQNDTTKKDEKKAGRGPLVDVDAFLREYDRDKDGSLSKEEMPDWLHYNFARLDGDKDGKISKQELEKGMAYLQQRRRPSDVVFVLIEMSDCDEGCVEEVQRAYQMLFQLDKNRDGKLDADELKAGRTQILKERVERIFKRLDADRDGKISKDEARGLVKENFAALDANKDGSIDSDELLAGAGARPADDKEDKNASPQKK